MRFILWIWRAPLPEWLRTLLMWTFNAKFVATVAVVLLNEQGEVLLFNHTYRREFPWALPGGWLEHGEEPEPAITREVLEESGLEVRILSPLWVGRDKFYPRLDIIFLGQVTGGNFRPSNEVSEARYFAVEDMPPVGPGTRRLVEKAQQLRELKTLA